MCDVRCDIERYHLTLSLEVDGERERSPSPLTPSQRLDSSPKPEPLTRNTISKPQILKPSPVSLISVSGQHDIERGEVAAVLQTATAAAKQSGAQLRRLLFLEAIFD